MMAVPAVVLALVSGCAGGSQSRTVLVDYGSDQFAAAFLDYYPKSVAVRQGDTVVFRQTWTGEAHTVTMGTTADKYGALIEKAGYFKLFDEKGYEGLPPEPPKDIKPLDDALPTMLARPAYDRVAQNGAQPCYVSQGLPPQNPDKACTKTQQKQPEFTGRQSYYNSGYIHYAGTGGNTFRVNIADNAKPGRYFFYCNNHGPFMGGWLTVKRQDEKVPSQEAVNRAALKDVNKSLIPLRKEFRAAQQRRSPVPPDIVGDIKAAGLPTATQGGQAVYTGRWSGFGAEGVNSAFGLEFVPKKSTVRAGEKVTWLSVGGHTISFDVPKYFPIFTVKKDGTVVRNPKLDTPAGGAPKLPPDHNGVLTADGGTYNGSGFWSSGFFAADKFAVYSLRISKPGTYKYACLVHPAMVGTLTVTA
jgi:plastocyanin